MTHSTTARQFQGILVLFMMLATALPSRAQVRLPRLIRDSMVLQRDTKIKLWGWAAPSEKISVRFSGQSYKTRANKDGHWLVELRPVKAGGPHTMTIEASNHLVLKDILVGEVWLCAGQSNMVHQMALHSTRYAKEMEQVNYPGIRQFWVPNVTSLKEPQENLPGGSWKAANPETIGEFSAVAYFFAKSLYEKYQVPIGIINASWGGVPIESMMSEESLKDFPSIMSTIEKNRDITDMTIRNNAGPASRPSLPADKGIAEKWFSPAYVPKAWRRIAVPGYWEDQGIKDLDGTVWYRRVFEVPATMTGVSAKVFLGRIVDADVLYVNGKQVGSTGYMYPQRRYTIPAGVLVPGKNLFVVKVTNNAGKGGFVPDKPYQLMAGGDSIDLTGYWEYKVGQVNQPFRGGGGSPALQNQPAALYHAMIAPLVNYAVKGFVWYQGESNTGRPQEYARLQPAMIADWRSKWQEPDAPFLFVQLPGFMEMRYQPAESQWAVFREVQAQSLAVPHTAMAVAIDLGEWNDIHPDRKKEVGDRLALAAEKVAYQDQQVVYSGPQYDAVAIKGDTIELSFSHVGGGLITADGEAPGEFAIAGADKKFVWASTKIAGGRVLAWNDEVIHPMYVRYAWADNPVNPNLFNREGLPAAPFRTDR